MAKLISCSVALTLFFSAIIAVRADSAREVTVRRQPSLQLATKKVVQLPSIGEVSLARRENNPTIKGVVGNNKYFVFVGENQKE